MIKAYKHEEIEPRNKEVLLQDNDIIVRRKVVERKINEKGEEIKITKYKEVNLTKKINETAKMIKQENAEAKLKELEKIFTNNK